MKNNDTIGPKTKKLIFHIMARDAVSGGDDPFAQAMEFLTSSEGISSGFHKAREDAMAYIHTVRQAAEPNPFKEMSDEDIAGEILSRIEDSEQNKGRW